MKNKSNLLLRSTPFILLISIIFTIKAFPQVNTGCQSTEIEDGCSEGEHININGISLYYEIWGTGEPLLLMHFGGGSAENFNPILPKFKNQYRIITPDARAQGRSTDSDEPLSYRLMVDDMIALLDSLNIDSAFVGGASDGAAIAIHMAIHYPKRVRGLVLGPVDLSSEGLTDLFWEEIEQYNVPEKLTELWFETRITPTNEQLAGIDIPALFIIGEEEQYIKLEHIAWQYQTIQNSETVWIPDSNHFHFITHPDEVSQAILSFLDKY